MEGFTENSCREFARLLASRSPVPGGGGASALVGALGAALCSMAGNFTLGKEKYAAVSGDMERLTAQAERLRCRLLELAEEDADAFLPLSEAYAIPRDDPRRSAVLEAATLGALRAPVEMVEQCCAVVELLEEMLEKGSALLLSDVGCGALLSGAAMESAAMNVYINTAALRDRERARAVEGQTDDLLARYGPRARAVAAAALARIRKE